MTGWLVGLPGASDTSYTSEPGRHACSTTSTVWLSTVARNTFTGTAPEPSSEHEMPETRNAHGVCSDTDKRYVANCEALWMHKT